MISDSFPVIRLMETGRAPVAAPLLPDDLAALGLDGTRSRADGGAPRMGASAAAEPADLPAVHVCGAATSSMDVAHALATAGELPPWGSVIAASQTAGKGQLGRRWHSPRGNIYAALRLPAVPPFTHTAAAPAVGGLMAWALNAAGAPVRMKWPNDIVAFVPADADPATEAGSGQGNALPEAETPAPRPRGRWRKVGGILIEERHGVVIAGIGLNLCSAPPDAALRRDHALPAGALGRIFPRQETADSGWPRPAALWARLAAHMFLQYKTWVCGEDWLDLAERHLAFRGRPVSLVDDEGSTPESVRGILDGLDASGGLRLTCLSAGDGTRARPDARVFLSGGLRLPQMADVPAPDAGPQRPEPLSPQSRKTGPGADIPGAHFAEPGTEEGCFNPQSSPSAH